MQILDRRNYQRTAKILWEKVKTKGQIKQNRKTIIAFTLYYSHFVSQSRNAWRKQNKRKMGVCCSDKALLLPLLLVCYGNESASPIHTCTKISLSDDNTYRISTSLQNLLKHARNNTAYSQRTKLFCFNTYSLLY